MNPRIDVSGLGFSFPGTDEWLFEDVDLQVRAGEVVAVVGLSGSGKTTLCNCISGIIPLIRPGTLEGEVRIDGIPTTGMNPPELATRLGIVFQNPETQLFFPVVEDELAFGPENLCIEPGEIEKRIERALATVGMEAFRFRNPHQLSGGQKQLIALASVLTLDPGILIFDEAMSQLDETSRHKIKNLILSLKGDGKAILMVEHNPDNLDIADETKILRDGGLWDFDGTWDTLISP